MTHFTESFRHTDASRPASGWTRRLAGWIAAWHGTLKRRRAFKELVTLDDRSLRDIGLTRSDLGDDIVWVRQRERLIDHHVPHV